MPTLKTLPIMGQILRSRTSHCSKHGEYESHQRKFGKVTPWDCCPGCVREGNVLEKRADSRNKLPWLLERREHMTFDNYDCSRAKNWKPTESDKMTPAQKVSRIKSYIDNFKSIREKGTGLCIAGGTGTGKTHLVTAIGIALNKAGFTVEYKRLYELMRDIKKTYNKAELKTEEEIIKNLGQFDLLILDEVGLKELTPTEIALTYEIVDLRYELIKPTILVSNLTFEHLEDFIGSRTIDRMLDNGGVKLNLNWESHRRK